MSVITPDNLKFTPTPDGEQGIANQKALFVDSVVICDSSGFRLTVPTKSEIHSHKLAISFDSEFVGDFSVKSIELYQDDLLLGIVTRQVEDVVFTIFNLQKGYVYIAGLVLDFIESKHTLTVNRYKGTLTTTAGVSETGNLSMVDTLLGIINAKQVETLISHDSDNDLIIGSDNKLFISAINQAIVRERHTYTQAIPATVWTINHNLGVQPQISVLSLGGMLMLAEILHTSTNQAIIYFDNPTAGIANCI